MAKISMKNSEGYSDPTASIAIARADEEMKKVRTLIRTILYICNLAGFRVIGRIELQDKRSGKTWK